MDIGNRNSIKVLFEDTDKSVNFVSDHNFIELLKKITPGWPFQILQSDQDEIDSSLLIEENGSGYLVSSKYSGTTKKISDPVDVVCEIVAELAWATIDANPDWLCLHCAACKIGGGLVLFPNKRRVGKSTLATVMGMKGVPIFTDDFLAITINDEEELAGIASGTAARMRMPWPNTLTPQMKGKLERSMIASSKAYSYHTNPGALPVRRGRKSPIRSLVLLNRDDAREKAYLEPIAKEKVLTAIIIQNFARARNAERILAILHFLASNIETYQLSFSSAEDAADAMIDFFSIAEIAKAPRLPKTLLSAYPEGLPIQPVRKVAFEPNTSVKQSNEITSHEIEGAIFLADQNGYGIHKLNPIGAAIWKLLADPVTVLEIEEIIIVAFPDTPANQIRDDIEVLIQKFLTVGLADKSPEAGGKS